MNNYIFTSINPTNEKETKINIDHYPAEGYATLTIKNTKINIDHQQLMELGSLLVTLAGENVDHSSATELLAGYNLYGLPQLLKLTNELTN